MDVDLEKKLQDTIESVRQFSIEDIDMNSMDPIVKMMLVALIAEEQKIRDYVDNATQRLVERYCSDFVPHTQINAIPAITILGLTVKKKMDSGMIHVGAQSTFSYKTPSRKLPLNYIPIFNTSLIPLHNDLFVLTSDTMKKGHDVRSISMESKNQVWIGIPTNTEIESVQGLSMLVKGTGGLLPDHIYVGDAHKELNFATMREMESIDMLEPFDAQQSSGKYFACVNDWKECLLNMADDALLYITDDSVNRDLFKPRPYPRVFQQWLEDEVLDCFDANTLWLHLVFPEGYAVPESCQVMINVLPVVNVDVNSLTLTQAQPIAKLQKQDDSFFLALLETSTASHKQGFSMSSDEIIVRDFDVSCYHNGDLYRDIRNLYNRFIDDYYAFIEYNGIKDGEVLKMLRETINKLGKCVGERNPKFKFDSGTFVMKNMNQYPPTITTKVNYVTTQGKIGNEPQIGDVMDNKKLPAVEQKATVVAAAMGGTDKASADEMYELLRYYTLTNDRLYTKADVDGFVRKEIMAQFGKEEFNRILVRMNIEGSGGGQFLQRGLYIDIEFKDKKNYEKAIENAFDKTIKQKIMNKSCISMPIHVKLVNLDC